MTSKIITDKIDELIELARLKNEPHVQLTLMALQGARLMGNEKQLFDAVNNCIQNILIPNAMAAKENEIASKN